MGRRAGNGPTPWRVCSIGAPGTPSTDRPSSYTIPTECSAFTGNTTTSGVALVYMGGVIR
jgi:hypothetical protein